MSEPVSSASRPVEVPVPDPDIKAFREADCDAVRAGVLLAAPIGTLLRWRPLFERFCTAVQFDDGLKYISALADATRSRRHRGALGTTELDAARMTLLGLADSIPRPRSGHWREPLPEDQQSEAAPVQADGGQP